MKQQQLPPSRLWRLAYYDNGAMVESTRSASSESSTIPVIDDETQKPCFVRRYCQCDNHNNNNNNNNHNTTLPQQQERHVHFAATSRVIPNPNKKVRFAEKTTVIHDARRRPQEVANHKLWYSERDFARFRQSNQEMCHYFGDRPWFLHLTAVYRALRDGEDKPVSSSSSSSNDSNNNAMDVDPQYLGLETTVVNVAFYTRHETLRNSLQHWQTAAKTLPNIAARQVRRASFQQSAAVTQWAHYVAVQVARSVQEEA